MSIDVLFEAKVLPELWERLLSLCDEIEVDPSEVLSVAPELDLGYDDFHNNVKMIKMSLNFPSCLPFNSRQFFSTDGIMVNLDGDEEDLLFIRQLMFEEKLNFNQLVACTIVLLESEILYENIDLSSKDIIVVDFGDNDNFGF